MGRTMKTRISVWLRVLFVLGATGFAPPNPLPAAETVPPAPQWQEIELTFTAARDAANPYTYGRRGLAVPGKLFVLYLPEGGDVPINSPESAFLDSLVSICHQSCLGNVHDAPDPDTSASSAADVRWCRVRPVEPGLA